MENTEHKNEFTGSTCVSVSHRAPQKIFYCFYPQTLKDKLSVPYMKLSYFVSPLYMAYSYEEIQGPQHNQLAQLLDDTSFYLNSTFTTLRHEVVN